MTFLQLLQVLGIPALIVSVVGFLVQFFTKRKFSKKDNAEELEIKKNQEHEDKLHDLETRTLALEQTGKDMRDELKSDRETLQFMSMGIQSLLRDRMIQMFDTYMEEEYLPISARENLDKMFTAYEGLDGNGTTKDFVKEMRKLPVKRDDRI